MNKKRSKAYFVYRSAITGRFISKATWEREPKNTTIRERREPK